MKPLFSLLLLVSTFVMMNANGQNFAPEPLTPSITISGDYTLCTGDMASISASVSGAGTNPVYNWYVNGEKVTTSLCGWTINNGLVGFYPFNGNANDASGNGKNGTVTGATLTTNRFGVANSAYSFNGSGNYITIPIDFNVSALPAMTIVAWVKPTSGTAIRQVISHDNSGFDRSLGIDNRGGGTGWSCFKGDGVLGYYPVVTDTWVQLAVRFNQSANAVSLFYNTSYVNGTSNFNTGWTTARIGSNPSFGEYFSGIIDDVRIYNRLLSNAEIIALHNNSAIDSLYCYYPSDGDQVYCQVIADGGTSVVSNTITLSVMADPVPTISGSSTACQNSTENIYTTEAGMSDYSWSVSSGGTITEGDGTSSVKVTWSGSTPQTITLSYNNVNGCSPESPVTKEVSIYPEAVPGSVSGPSSILFGMDVTLTLSGHSGTIVQWQKRLDGGSWQDIPEAGSIYNEIPDTTGKWDYRAEVQNGPCESKFCEPFRVEVLPVTRNLKVSLLLESLFNSETGLMNKAQDESGDKFPGSVADQVTICAAKPVTPYAVCYVADSVDVEQDGTCTLTIPRTGHYFLVIRHRNSIETWTALPLDAVPDPVIYDFTSSSSQAYGDNMKKSAGRWVIWGGDVNQDGIVDASDMNPVDNASTSITFGYIPEDVNGDGIVDGSDMNTVDNNTTAIIMALHP